MEILNILWDYRFIIIGIIGIIIYAIINPSDFKVKIYQAMLYAKQMAKEGILKTGKEQEQWVVDNISAFVGKKWSIVVKILGEEKIRSIIQTLYSKALDVLDDGQINNSQL